MPYQNFVIDPELKTDVWVRASQVCPGNPSVVHHLVVFVMPPDQKDSGPKIDFLAAYAPGMPPRCCRRSCQARPGRLPADVSGPLHPARHAADRPQRIGLCFADPKRSARR